ncbi:hypothetical protein [Devosia ginsengisoli]|uniref:hypothetical protein n=1 Tax=Devosia ginsengisoli TaxID=400770 RepID=UPI0026EA9C16|nr:hypothetical protein [Devosia ginsengisoli]MCR6673232.1 hypothetical protein [Devosia ginsengisoli]
MKDLETMLRERLSDSRACLAALDINADRVRIQFGAVGPLPKLMLAVKGNEISIRHPVDLAEAWQREDAAKRSRPSPLDPAPEAQAEDADAPIAAVLVDGRLFAGEGGREIELPEDFFELVAKALAEGKAQAEDAGGGDQQQIVPTDPNAHTKEALIALATATPGAEFKPSDTKAVIAAAIDKARGVASKPE